MAERTRKRMRVTGIVQGVGLRPHVWQRAQECELAGWVQNDSAGVTIEVQGSELNIARFVKEIRLKIPPLAKIDSLTIEDIPLKNERHFEIVESRSISAQSTPISPDIAVCDDCLREMQSPNDRRYRYPFINCTHCGPRFTIQEDIPYDRALTTMKSFQMCAECRQEYQNPLDRRFHAQPNACPTCGPTVWFVADATQEHAFANEYNANFPAGHTAIDAFRNAIEQGDIVAVKGIGGFHLVCDATNDLAIAKLRERKGRIDKPFAVMVSSIETCREFAIVSEEERALLESKARPILLLRKSSGKPKDLLSDLVAPGHQFIGVMLPYSPLHHLLLQDSPPIVMTSGNISDEPIVRENIEASQRLRALADRFLLHDRDIHVVCDDSVVRCLGQDLLPFRRSRGYAPMPIKLRETGPSVLAVGGELKATFCATKDQYAYMSQHLGDMGNLETLEAMQRSIDHFLRLFRIHPQALVADLHPSYLSAKWAKEFAQSLNIPCLQVQHHHAHIASLLAEHALPCDRPIIGCCFDGTGFGTDNTIWGGEFMIADADRCRRFAHIKYFSLPGGDESIRRPYRVALAQLYAAGLPWDERLPCVQAASRSERRILRQQLEKNIHCVSTSSMGRLFDAVAALIGVRQQVNYEAQAAMEMEAIAIESYDCCNLSSRWTDYSFQMEKRNCIEVDPSRLIATIYNDVISGTDPSLIARRFHLAVAQLIVDICIEARDKEAINEVGLSGGVFQNAFLLDLAHKKLLAQGFNVYLHCQVPPNDGGLALGQALIGQNRLLRHI